MAVAFCHTPLGPVRITGSKKGISDIAFLPEVGHSDPEPPDVITECILQLREYFAGTRTRFDLLLDLGDVPDFHREVWHMICAIPYGRTRCYSTIADILGRPGASRAVGQAVGKNPVAIVIPCHRVIGKHGRLRGYAFGLDVKRQLLQLENPGQFATQQELVFQEIPAP